MHFLKELLTLNESAEAPIEVVDVIKNFPNKYKSALQSLWGKEKLEFKGLSFFANGGFYDQLNDVVNKFVDSSKYHGIEVEIDPAAELDGKSFAVSYEDKTNPVKVGQESYVGFCPSKNVLLVGYDTSLDEELFNEEWDKQWDRTFGRKNHFDHENNEHNMFYDSFWREFIKVGACMVFEVDVSNGKVKVLRQADLPNFLVSFYNTGYKELHKAYPDLIDLRLD